MGKEGFEGFLVSGFWFLGFKGSIVCGVQGFLVTVQGFNSLRRSRV